MSQAERFDHKQHGGCERAWWFERVHDLRPDSTEAQRAGESGHELLAHYLQHGSLPEGRKSMKKAVTGAILKGELPKPGPDLLVEWRGDGQPKWDPAHLSADGKPQWLPLDTTKTLWLGGVPWELFIDLTFRRGPMPSVWDHKFKADLSDAKASSELIKTIQLPVYVLARQPFWPDAKRWEIAHHNVCKTGTESVIRRAVVSLDQVLERKADIEKVVARMKVVAKATNQEDVSFNRRSCSAWFGCPHQSICTAFKENKVEFTDEEKELFGDDLAGPTETEATTAAPVEEDDEAKLERQLAEAKAKKAAVVEAKKVADAKAAAEAAKPKARLKIEDVPSPTPAPDAEPDAKCAACGEAMTRENSARYPDKTYKHIGCPKDAPPASEPAKKTTKKAKAADSVEVPLTSAQGEALGKLLNASEPPKSVEISASRSAAVAEVLEAIAKLIRAN